MPINVSCTHLKLDGDSDDAFSVLFGFGVDMDIAPRLGLFVEGKFIIGFTENESTQTLPIRLGG